MIRSLIPHPRMVSWITCFSIWILIGRLFLFASDLPELVVTPPKMARGITAPEGLRPALLDGAGSSQKWISVPGEERLPPGVQLDSCFDAHCSDRISRKVKVSAVLVTSLRSLQGTTGKPGLELTLALYFANNRVVHALHRPILHPDSLLSVARAAAFDLVEGREGVQSGRWEEIRWLSPRDSTDRNRILRYGLLGAVVAAGGVALAQNQWRSDPFSDDPLTIVAASTSRHSAERGFFSTSPMDARSIGRGGAGAMLSQDALAVMTNPAMLADLRKFDLILARGLAPDGSPRLAAALGSPAHGYWGQGGALYYVGDRIASEATIAWGGGIDLEAWESRFSGILLGITGKLYLAQVGEEGTGVDRSRGRTMGMGLDGGVVLPLEERLRMAFALKDIPGFLWHRNDFTDQSEKEWLPVEFQAAAQARSGKDLEIFLEGQTALAKNAPVHIRIGAESALGDFQMLKVRSGYHQIFGEETVRRLAVGFGIDTHALRSGPSLALQFAFEFGLGDHEALEGSQQFSLEFGF